MRALISVLAVTLSLAGCASDPSEPAAPASDADEPAAHVETNYETVEVATGGDIAGALYVDGTPVQSLGWYVDVSVPQGARNATLEVTRSPSTPAPDSLRFELGECGWVDIPMASPGQSGSVTVALCAQPAAGSQHLSYNLNGASQFTFRLLAEVPAVAA